MTLEFDNYVSDEDLATAAEFYDELELELDAMEDELSWHNLEDETLLADAEWDEHWKQCDMERLDYSVLLKT